MSFGQNLARSFCDAQSFLFPPLLLRYTKWVDIEAHFLNLRLLQQAHQQKCYQPPSHLLLCRIQKEWSLMEEAEHQRDLKIRQELSRFV